MAGVASMAEPLLFHCPLIDSTGIAHQKHGPDWERAEQPSEFMAGQSPADGPLVDRIHDSIKKIIAAVVVANESGHGARSVGVCG